MSILARPQRLIPLLAALVAFAPLSIDTYLPSLPLIARDLGAGESDVQMTISVFLAGLCLGMLGYGPLSDRFGRRRLLLGGIVLYLLATIGCIVADSSTSLILWRFLQALGGASAAVLARAIVRDLFPLAEAARVLSLMHLVTMFATLVAPLLGSLLADIAGWRAIFAALLGFALMCLLAVTLRIPETHPSDNRGRSVADAFRAYWIIATDARAIGYLLCMGLRSAACSPSSLRRPSSTSSSSASSPQTYAWLFSMNIGGIIVVTWLNARLVGRLGPAAHAWFWFAGGAAGGAWTAVLWQHRNRRLARDRGLPSGLCQRHRIARRPIVLRACWRYSRVRRAQRPAWRWRTVRHWRRPQRAGRGPGKRHAAADVRSGRKRRYRLLPCLPHVAGRECASVGGAGLGRVPSQTQ